MKPASRYAQIIAYYKHLIETGALAQGEKMPTEAEMCELFGVSRITVRQAMDGLVQLGLISKVQGKGSYVSFKKTGMQLNHLVGFSEEMRSLGLKPSSVLLSRGLMAPGGAVAKALQSDAQQQVYVIKRLRCADGIPMSVEQVHIPFFRFPGIESLDLTGSLYMLFQNYYGCECAKAVQHIQAGAATAADARYLQIKPGFPVLNISRTTYESGGQPIEYVESVYRGDRYVFTVTLE